MNVKYKIKKALTEKNIFRFFLLVWMLSIPFKNAAYQISQPFLVVFFVYHLFVHKRFEILKDNLQPTKMLGIGILFILISMSTSNLINPELLGKKSWHITFMFIFRYALMFVILAYFYALDFFSKKELFFGAVASLFFVGLGGVCQILFNFDTVIIAGQGVVGTLSNRNAMGLFMGMGAVSSFFLFIKRQGLGIFLMIFFVFLMIFSFSRSSWVASFCSIMVMMAINYKNIKLQDIKYIVLFGVAILMLYLSSDSFEARFEQLVTGYSSHRIDIWAHTITLIKQNPLFGYGVDSWEKIADTFMQRYDSAHSMPLEILLYTGICGFIACFYSIFLVLVKIIKSKNFIYLGFATYFLVVTQFDFGAYTSKELLSFLTIFVFFVYVENFRKQV